MRVLRFIVKGQHISPDPACDFTKIVRGSKGYLKAVFSMDAAWKGCKVAASFWCFDEEFAAPVQNSACEIPSEALQGLSVGVSLVGVKSGYKICTNRVKFEQEVG